MYVDMIVNLWLGQPASMGDGPGQRPVKPSDRVPANTPAAVTEQDTDINTVDWISLASLRNDSPDLNPLADYDHPSNQLSATTRPSYLKGWFQAAGATCLWDNTCEILPTSDWKELVELSDYIGGWVLMLVSASLFTGQAPTSKNHWVVLNGPITVDGRNLSMYRANMSRVPENREAITVQAVFSPGEKPGGSSDRCARNPTWLIS